MPARAEVLRDGPIGRKEPLRLARAFEPLHALLSLACRLVRVLGTIVEIPILAMFHLGQEFALGGSIALELIGDDHARDVGQSFEQLTEELLRGPLVPATLHQDIQQGAVLIDRPPEIVVFALDGEKHLVEMPIVTGSRPTATELVGVGLAKLAAPLANRLIGYNDSTLKEQLFHVTKTETEPKIEPHGVTDDLDGEAVVLIGVAGRWVHAPSMAHCLGTGQVALNKLTKPPGTVDFVRSVLM